jgi:hypothetical protein
MTETELSVSTVKTESRAGLQTLRKWAVKLALFFAIAAPLNFMLAGIGAKLGLWNWQFGLGTLTRQVGPLLLIGALVTGVIAFFIAILVKPRKGIVIALAAILIGIAGFGRLMAVQNTVANLPFIHDVTTDTEDPPMFGAVIMAERNETEGVNTVDYAGKTAPATMADGTRGEKLVSALQTQAYPEIRTLVLSDSEEVVFGRAEQLAKDMGWAIKEADLESGRIDATDTTFWYGFKDDVTIRLRPAAGGGTRVDVRSVSRVGGSDLGANAKRVGEFLDALAR